MKKINLGKLKEVGKKVAKRTIIIASSVVLGALVVTKVILGKKKDDEVEVYLVEGDSVNNEQTEE